MNPLSTLALICAVMLAACAAPQLRGGEFEPSQAATEIVLTTQRGQAEPLSQQRVQGVLIFVG